MRFAFHRDVALGRYVSLETPVHRLDPRTKLLVFAGILVALFRSGLAASACLVAIVAGLLALARVPRARALASLSALSWIFALTFLFQTLWVGPSRLGGFAAGAEAGVLMTLRLAGMVLAATLLTFTTEPIRLADGLSRLFAFLERVRIPARDLAMVLALALRFLPTVMEEAQRIVIAQQARGARFEGGLLTRARRLLPLAVPLFVGCIARADTLALAMEARGWRGSGRRTQMDPLAFRAPDAWALGAAIAILAATFLLGPGA
jgi:energy-coupling factor transport system permease protein